MCRVLFRFSLLFISTDIARSREEDREKSITNFESNIGQYIIQWYLKLCFGKFELLSFPWKLSLKSEICCLVILLWCEPLSCSLAEEPLLPCISFNWDATVEIGVAGTHRDSYFYLTLYTFNFWVNDHARSLCLDAQLDSATTYLSFNTFTSSFVKITLTYLAAIWNVDIHKSTCQVQQLFSTHSVVLHVVVLLGVLYLNPLNNILLLLSKSRVCFQKATIEFIGCLKLKFRGNSENECSAIIK